MSVVSVICIIVAVLVFYVVVTEVVSEYRSAVRLLLYNEDKSNISKSGKVEILWYFLSCYQF